ncbi:MAG: tetratricopeptide repeat protein [Sideroxydans sp.]|nr:tetratricopeptide repeat protein [Sideroxydans sp.]
MWPSPKPCPSNKQAFVWLALAITLAYASALIGPFQFDDYKVIANYSGVHSWANWAASLGIRPLLKASYTLDWTLGWGTVGFHISNLLIHLLTSWVVYLLTQHFIANHERLRGHTSLPLFVALLFALHPAHTEAVSYISGRSASQMSLFYLGGLLAYTHGRHHASALHLHLLTPLCFLAALLCKETAITFPFALLLWERYALNDRAHDFKAQWTSWGLLLAALLLFLFSTVYQTHMARSAHFNTLGGNFATQANGMLWLLQQWTLPLWLNIDPDLPLYRHLFDAPLPLLFTLALITAAWWLRKLRPWWTFALAWTVLQLLPLYVLLPRIDIANERQLYLVGWPLALALCTEIAARLQARRTRIVILTLLLAAALLTVLRNQDYRSETALWQATAQLSPNKARAHNNLGYASLLADNKEEARREFERALQLDPQHVEAAGNLQKLENKKAGALPRP